MATGGNSPGSALDASIAREIGTCAWWCGPNVTGAPVSRLVATRNSLRPSLRKSLVRPGAANRRARNSSIARLSNTPVGMARASVEKDSSTPRWKGSFRYCSVARAARPGSAAAQRANSPNAGRRKISGFSAASTPSSMNSRYICAGESPLASAAATKPPDDTPT